MRSRNLRLPALALTTGLIGLGSWAGTSAAASFDELTGVPSANPKSAGFTYPNLLSPELTESVLAQGSFKLENGTAQVPSTATTATVRTCRRPATSRRRATRSRRARPSPTRTPT